MEEIEITTPVTEAKEGTAGVQEAAVGGASGTGADGMGDSGICRLSAVRKVILILSSALMITVLFFLILFGAWVKTDFLSGNVSVDVAGYIAIIYCAGAANFAVLRLVQDGSGKPCGFLAKELDTAWFLAIAYPSIILTYTVLWPCLNGGLAEIFSAYDSVSDIIADIMDPVDCFSYICLPCLVFACCGAADNRGDKKCVVPVFLILVSFISGGLSFAGSIAGTVPDIMDGGPVLRYSDARMNKIAGMFLEAMGVEDEYTLDTVTCSDGGMFCCDYEVGLNIGDSHVTIMFEPADRLFHGTGCNYELFGTSSIADSELLKELAGWADLETCSIWADTLPGAAEAIDAELEKYGFDRIWHGGLDEDNNITGDGGLDWTEDRDAVASGYQAAVLDCFCGFYGVENVDQSLRIGDISSGYTILLWAEADTEEELREYQDAMMQMYMDGFPVKMSVMCNGREYYMYTAYGDDDFIISCDIYLSH